MTRMQPKPSLDHAMGASVVVTGATGRLGRLLHLLSPQAIGGLPAIWTARHPLPDGVLWDIGPGPAPTIPPQSVILHLAGVVRGDPGQLLQNAVTTQTVCQAAQASGARHVFLASTAAVYRPGPEDIPESTPPFPASPYGVSKLAAEEAARRVLGQGDGPGLTILRIGNVAGADALLGNTGKATLDPVAGQIGGPLRSYIGPCRLISVLCDLIALVVRGGELPRVLNVAEPGVVAMADLLLAAGRDWHFGPSRPQTVPRVGLDTSLLGGLVPMERATANGIVADLASLAGRWP